MHETCGETSILMTVQPDTRHPLRVQPVEGIGLNHEKDTSGDERGEIFGGEREGRPYHN